jgi:hypothetical protein
VRGTASDQDVAERFGVPVVHDEEKSLVDHGVRDMLHEHQGRVIGPVRVVEDDQNGPIL